MPSKKPRLQILLEENEYQKFKTIAEKERRTESNLGKIAILNYISSYEEKNGTIKTVTIGRDNNGNITL